MLLVQTSVKVAMLAATTVLAAHAGRAVTAWLQERRSQAPPEILEWPALVAGIYNDAGECGEGRGCLRRRVASCSPARHDVCTVETNMLRLHNGINSI
jgi:hypothetical protein